MTCIIDFDGTISVLDTVDELLKKYADPQWEVWEEKWQAGEISARQCMAEQVNLVKITPEQLEAFTAELKIDNTFRDFIEAFKDKVHIIVVSDGLDYISQRKVNIELGYNFEIYANKLVFSEEGLSLEFPFSSSTCEIKAGMCKCAIAAKMPKPIICIGDARSDFCLARKADIVFAKRALKKFCVENHLPHYPFDTFADIISFAVRLKLWKPSSPPKEGNVSSPGRPRPG